MSMENIFVGIIIFFFCLFLSLSVGSYFISVDSSQVDLLRFAFIGVGLGAIIIGAMSK